MVQSSPISAVSPITTPMPWSMNTRSPIFAPGWISMPVRKRPQCEIQRASQCQPRSHSGWAMRCSTRAWKPGYENTTSHTERAAGSRSRMAWV